MKDLTFKQLEDIINGMTFEAQSCKDLVRSVNKAITKVLEEHELQEEGFVCTPHGRNLAISYIKDKYVRYFYPLEIKVNKAVVEKGNGEIDWRKRTVTLYKLLRITVGPSFDLGESRASIRGYFNYILDALAGKEKEKEAQRKKFLEDMKKLGLTLEDLDEMLTFYNRNKNALREM